ncbi:hypothetical protein [Pseudomonas sp. MH9.3]|uniref:hypothetical protein n=1 Tax=Pseudomonas sp. MH9.3 TaxID=3048630 RepID=UPI002AC9828B|nr:hypothetical protein [Pseudomonas sp. MH9.3]MEB0108271.1 hypothetical protein [Pseudomonas sp. MH9.3]WPX80470.1 hypothetical protein RHM60_04975 [Pseudomonas sp. MH9.3]WQG57596.1 hypothetical protein RHM66_21850 [Pseudomonas sp. RTB3]
MISNHLSMIEELRPAADELAAQVAEFVAAGGEIEVAEPPPPPKPVVYVPQEPPAPKPFVRRRAEPLPPTPPTKREDQIEARRQRAVRVMELAPHHSQSEVANMTGISRRMLLNMSREFNFKFKAVPPGRHGNPDRIKAMAERDARFAERIKAFMEIGVSRRKVCGKLGISAKTFARILKNHAIDYPLSTPGGTRCAA